MYEYINNTRREAIALSDRDPNRWREITKLPAETYLLFIEAIPPPKKNAFD